MVDLWAYGSLRDADTESSLNESVTTSTRYLVASLTKPVTATAMMKLVEDGTVTLSTPAAHILPAFGGEGRNDIEIWHLLTHTSGLPDMVPENIALRKNHATLDEFFAHVCRCRPAFAPGTQVSYQSTGLLVLAKIIEKLSGKTLREFAAAELFRPAGMTDSHLGLEDHDSGSLDAQVELTADQAETDWHWNSRYWRQLGAPWGGLTTTASDVAAFLHLFLNQGRSHTGSQVLTPNTVAEMTRDWLTPLGISFPWGLGWKLKGEMPLDKTGSTIAGPETNADSTLSIGVAGERRFMGNLTSPLSFGHLGSTGCAMWVDPNSRIAAVLLTNSPTCRKKGLFDLTADTIAAATR